ncbi:hypothetical protein [Streptomyces sp. YIM S03343]
MNWRHTHYQSAPSGCVNLDAEIPFTRHLAADTGASSQVPANHVGLRITPVAVTHFHGWAVSSGTKPIDSTEPGQFVLEEACGNSRNTGFPHCFNNLGMPDVDVHEGTSKPQRH